MITAGSVPTSAQTPTRPVVTNPETWCLCGLVLAHVNGAWQHTASCLECLNEPGSCPQRHAACTKAEPVTCNHEPDWGCRETVALAVDCAYGRAPRTCCSCCWITSDD